MRDNTLLSRLGFADPDKKNQLHDLACLYLTQREVIERVCKMTVDRSSATSNTEIVGTALEVALSKGEGKFKTTIGFVDVLWKCTTPRSEYIGIEVKISKEEVGQLIRQINLYRDYIDCVAWIVFVHYDVNYAYRQALEDSGIYTIRLGHNFDAFVANQQTSSRAVIDEI